MSNAVAKVSFLQGQAWAKAPDGTLRALTVGSTLNDDEILVTAQGARIELDVGTGEPLVVNGGVEVGMSRDFLADTATGADEALLSDASVQEALTVLEQGGDLLEELEETAAGDTGGGSSSEGHNFVQLTRVIESTDSQAFDYSSASQSGQAQAENDAGYINRAPLVTDQVIASNEDEPVTGQIIADDIEDDTLTFNIATPPAKGTLVLDPETGQFTFTPNANYNGPDSFVVTVTDSRGNSTNTSITLNIAPVNDAPTTNDINLTTDEDVPVNGQVVAQDIENDTLSYTVSGQPANGSVVLDPVTGAFVYSPNANYNGGDSFVVTVSDGNGGTTTSTVTIGINPVNDAPVSSDQNLVTEEDTPIDGQVVASDVDGDTLGYSVSGQPTNGSVVLNPATGGFTYTPNANYNGSDSFVVTISDGKGGTTTSTISIGVTPVNDAPESSDQSLTTPEDTPLSGQVVASDIENDTLAYVVSGQPGSGTVTLNPATGSFVYTPNANYNGSDSFVVTISDGNGGTITSTISIGVTPVNDAPVSSDQNLTTPEDTPLSGQVVASDIENDTLAYVVSGQPGSGTVTLNPATGSFVYTPNANYNGSDSFVVTISDGNGGTTTSRINIGVTPVNDAPVSGNQNLSTPEDTPINGQISASDIDGGSLSYNIVGSPANGSVTLNSTTGRFVYTPNAGYNGSDSFVVTISDGNGGTTTSTVTIGVTPVNDAPIAVNDSAITDEDTAVTVAVRGNDTDPDGNSLTVTNVTQGANGSVVIDAVTGNPIYTPNANFVGSDSFTYTVNDGNGGSATATVSVKVNAVTPVNTAPVAVTESIDVAEGGTATLLVGGATSVLSNDSDAENNPLTAILVSGTSNGTLTLNADGTFSYTPNAGFNGSDSFTYKVNDGTVDGNTVTVNINVTPVNDAPVAVADSITVAEGGTATLLVGGASSVLSNDSDAENNPLTAILVSGPANGTLTFNADGTFSYVHDGSETTSDSFSYKVNDGTVDGNTVTVNINVTPVNDAPVAVADSITVAEGGTATLLVGGASSVLSNDSDAENNPLIAILVTGTSNGTLTLNADGTFSYTPNAGFNGSDSFTYKINDGTVDGNTVTVNINVTPVNDAPVAVADSITVAEGGTVTLLVGGASSVLSNDSDAENNPLTAILVTGTSNGTLTLNADGTFSYTPNAGFNGSDSFTYKVNDGTVDGNTVTVNINVTPVNDAPVAVADSITVAEGGTATLLVGGASSVLTNDSDAENNPLTAILVTGTSNGTLTLNADGTFSYVHDGSETTSDSFTYKVNDGTVDGNTVTVNINVTPVNDAPVAVADSITVAEGGTATLLVGGASSVLTNDSDAENNPLTAILVTGTSNGTLTLNADGTFSYVHDGSQTTSDSFTYKVNDGTVDGNTVTVNINVTPVNDAPVAVADSITVAEGGTATLLVGGASSVLTNDSDAENNPLTAILVSGTSNGTLTLNADGTFSYVHDGSQTTSDSFTYKVNDGTVDGNTVTVNINVTPVNDVPVAVADSITVAEGGTATLLVGGASSVLSNDSDAENNPLTAILVSGTSNGTLTLNADGTFSYVHDGSQTTSDSFTYKVNDGTVDGNTVTVNINVTPVNDAPVAVADNATMDQDQILTLTAAQLLINDTDPDLDTLTIDSVQGAVNGSVSIVGGDVVFTPTPGYFGPASFTYTVSDGHGGTSTATVSVTVAKANTAPVANDDAAAASGSGNIGFVSEYFGYSDTVNGPNLSSLQMLRAFIDGRTPDATFVAKTFDYGNTAFNNGLGNGTNLQSFLGSDAASLSADPATTSDAIIRMRGFVELGAGTYNFKVTADDGYQIRVDGVVVAEINQNQTVNTTTHNTFTLSTSGVHTVEILYWDQGISARLKMELSDDAGASYDIFSSLPTYQNVIFSAVEDTAFSIPASSLLGNDTDADGDTLVIQSVQGAVNGTVSLVAGSVVFTPAANYSGPASFTYTVSDGKGGTDTATVNLVVAPVNDAPTTVADSAIAATNGSVSIPITTLLANDSDADGEIVSFVSVQGAVNGTVTVSGANVVFTPTANYEGPASFTYTVRDPLGNSSNGSVTVNVGGASAASIAVLKSVVAIAHGTGGTSVKFPIMTSLVDTDGSETLAIKISGVPTGLSFNSGTNLGGGVWQFTTADLPDLTLNLPGSYITTNTNLTVQVIATETTGGLTATTSATVALRAGYTTVDIATTESGSYTGTPASEYIQGGSGNNTISAANGNNVVYGGDGDDTITAGGGNDVIFGGNGNDSINSGVGSDRISGGAGNDTMSGFGDNFVDVFVWGLGDQGAAGAPAEDTINNFSTNAAGNNTNGGDVLDLRDLLQGEHIGASNGAGNLADFLHFEISGANTIVHISHTGGFSGDTHTVSASYTGAAETQKITLTGVNLQSLYSGATTDQQIITQLLNNNKLITD